MGGSSRIGVGRSRVFEADRARIGGERRSRSTRYISVSKYTFTSGVSSAHKLMASVGIWASMTDSLTAAFGAVPLQPGVAADPVGQLLIALVVVALVIIVGKFVLSLAWRLVSIGIVLVAVWFVLSMIGVI